MRQRTVGLGQTHKATDLRLRVKIVVLAFILLSSGCSKQAGHLLRSKGARALMPAPPPPFLLVSLRPQLPQPSPHTLLTNPHQAHVQRKVPQPPAR